MRACRAIARLEYARRRLAPRVAAALAALRAAGTVDGPAAVAVVRAVLTERQLLLVRWYWLDGRRQRDIADWLRCSRGAVHDRLRLVRLTLVGAGLPVPRRPCLPPNAEALRKRARRAAERAARQVRRD